jgi:hypothetical protein
VKDLLFTQWIFVARNLKQITKIGFGGKINRALIVFTPGPTAQAIVFQ